MGTFSSDKYATMDFPMFWHLENLRSDGEAALKEAIAKRKSLQAATDLHWRLFATNLTISFEEYTLKHYVQALDALAQCDDNIEGLKSCNDPLYVYSPEALSHVVVATRGFILTAMPGLATKGLSVLDDCLQTFKENIKITKFQSALIGIRSAVFMAYGVAGTEKAQEYIREALRLDNKVAEWHFLYGKCLGRLRRIFSYTEKPSAFELNHHNLAVKLSDYKVGYYLVYLAQCQRETAYRLDRCEDFHEISKEAKQLFETSVRNYHKAHELATNCCHVSARCALGFLKLPDIYEDVRLAAEIMEKAIERCPENPMFKHTWGLINERGLREKEVAMDYYQQAATLHVFGAWMDTIRLSYLEHRHAYNPVEDLTNLLTKFPEDYQKERITAQLGSFYLFQKNYLFKALDYFMEVFNKDPASPNLTVHRSIFMGLRTTNNLIHVVFDECRLKCGNQKTKDYERKKCQGVVVLLTFLYPELSKIKPKRYRDDIMQESFLYTHPWFQRQGREREKKKNTKETKSKSRSPAKRDGSKSQKKQKPAFTPYIPDPTTILKGWLTPEQQLAKHNSRKNHKLKREQIHSNENTQKTAAGTRTTSRDNEKEARSDRIKKWREASPGRDSSGDLDGLRVRNAVPSSSKSRADGKEKGRSDQFNNWRSGSRSRGSSMELDSHPLSHYNSRDDGKEKGRSDYNSDRRSGSHSRDTSVDSTQPPYAARSYRCDYSRSVSRGSTESRDPSMSWRTERLQRLQRMQRAEDPEASTPLSATKRLSLDQRNNSSDDNSYPRSDGYNRTCTRPSRNDSLRANHSTSPDNDKLAWRSEGLGRLSAPGLNIGP